MKLHNIFEAIGNLNENKVLVQLRDKLTLPIAKGMSKVGITPTLLNFAGLILGILSGIILGTGNFSLAAIVFTVSFLADAIDGPIARYQGIVSNLGAFFDSVFDRFVDIAVLAGITWYYFSRGQELLSLFALISIVGASVTSYAKARAESLGVKGRYVGFMNRPERVILLMIGIFFPVSLPVILGILALFSNITAIHRIVFYARKLDKHTDGDSPN